MSIESQTIAAVWEIKRFSVAVTVSTFPFVSSCSPALKAWQAGDRWRHANAALEAQLQANRRGPVTTRRMKGDAMRAPFHRCFRSWCCPLQWSSRRNGETCRFGCAVLSSILEKSSPCQLLGLLPRRCSTQCIPGACDLQHPATPRPLASCLRCLGTVQFTIGQLFSSSFHGR